jgi:hypothetical protein
VQISFGRTHPENQGLLQFKDGWGTERQKIFYYRYAICKKLKSVNEKNYTRFYEQLFQWAPISFLRLIGCMLYKHAA